MTSKNAQAEIQRMEEQLLLAPRNPMLDVKDWRVDVPLDAGVYVIWDREDVPRYVGETSNLLHRFGDLERSVNHTFRRKVKVHLKLDACTELELSKEIAKRYRISYLPVSLGRVELEEHLILKWSETIINKPTVRLRTTNTYKSSHSE